MSLNAVTKMSFCLQMQSSYDTVPPPKGELFTHKGTDCHSLCKGKLVVEHTWELDVNVMNESVHVDNLRELPLEKVGDAHWKI